MLRPRLLMFDLDGTLVDTLQDIATSANLTRVDFGLPPLPPREIIARVGDGMDALVRVVVPVGAERHAEALAALLRHYNAHLMDTTHLMPGALEVLERFHGRALAVVTNKLQCLSERILEHVGVRHRFRMVVGGDTLPTRKPSAGPLLHVLSACGVRPGDAVMIGDGVNDILAAQAAGVPVVAVTGGVNSRQELAALRPDCLVDGLAQISQVLA
jgi:phosphoglycolate phosphatase